LKTDHRPARHDAFISSRMPHIAFPRWSGNKLCKCPERAFYKQLSPMLYPLRPLLRGCAAACRSLHRMFQGYTLARRVFGPIPRKPGAAPRFNLVRHHVRVLAEIAKRELYPGGTTPDVCQYNFDTLLQLMRETHAIAGARSRVRFRAHEEAVWLRGQTSCP